MLRLIVDLDLTEKTNMSDGGGEDPFHMLDLLLGRPESHDTVCKRIAAGITVERNLPVIEIPRRET